MTPGWLLAALEDAHIGRRAVSRKYRGWISSASVALLLVTAGCSSPPERADETASGLGLEPVSVSGGGFKHRAYVRSDVRSSVAVNVYLEGDGLPWKTRQRVAADPTPRYPLALHLAARDPAPSLLLGRPCYYGITAPGPCRPWLWTSGRYSEEVVHSMAAALKRLLCARADRRITPVSGRRADQHWRIQPGPATDDARAALGQTHLVDTTGLAALVSLVVDGTGPLCQVPQHIVQPEFVRLQNPTGAVKTKLSRQSVTGPTNWLSESLSLITVLSAVLLSLHPVFGSSPQWRPPFDPARAAYSHSNSVGRRYSCPVSTESQSA